MISQAPTSEEENISDEYLDAWGATRIATVQEGKSWSGGERNHLFMGIGDARFVDVSRLSNADCPGDGRSVGIVDWDDDGKLDMLLRNRTAPRVQFFHNRFPQQGHFVAVELRGNGETTSRDAIHARVRVEAGGRTVQRTLMAGEGFLAQSSKRLHFGLGEAERIERITVAWPDGTETVHEDLAVDTRYRIEQSEGTLARIEPRTASLASVPHRPAEAKERGEMRMVLTYELPMGKVPIPSFDNPERRVEDLAGEPILLNLWEKSCAPCLVELGEFGEALMSKERLGARIVTLSLNGLAGKADALKLLRRKDMPTEDAGYLDIHSQAILFGAIYAHVHPPRNIKPQVTPTSFLIDRSSNLVAIYHGPVEVEQLRADLAELAREDSRPVLDRLRGGHRIIHHKRDFLELAEDLESLRTFVSEDGEETVPVNGREQLAEYYRAVDKQLTPYFMRNGERVELKEAPAKARQ